MDSSRWCLQLDKKGRAEICLSSLLSSAQNRLSNRAGHRNNGAKLDGPNQNRTYDNSILKGLCCSAAVFIYLKWASNTVVTWEATICFAHWQDTNASISPQVDPLEWLCPSTPCCWHRMTLAVVLGERLSVTWQAWHPIVALFHCVCGAIGARVACNKSGRDYCYY